MEKAYLVLENGMVFEGSRIGAAHDSIGELVFTTGVVGYPETLTDVAYAGQIVMQTFPLIGNYGIIEEDFENTPAVKGYVVRECCDTPSNFRCEYDLDKFLKDNNICGIMGVDTREITRVIRENGVMNAAICSSVPEDKSAIADYTVKGAVAEVTCKEETVYPAVGDKRFSVVLVDYGVKKSIVNTLCALGCEVTVVPCGASAERILELDPDGIMLSGGPGDPADNPYEIEQIKCLLGKKPIFGIGLGHQLVALAMGGATEKMKQGHRGSNQPVHDNESGKTYIASQNHGYVVVGDSISGVGEVSFVNVNDGTCEGINYPGKNCFTVQFDPTVCSRSKDKGVLLGRFIDMMGGKKNA